MNPTVQAIGRKPQRAPDGASVHNKRHRPEQGTLYRLVQQHSATFIAQAEYAAGADQQKDYEPPAVPGLLVTPRVMWVSRVARLG